jgi:MYXO-CTERM domain-containing protein
VSDSKYHWHQPIDDWCQSSAAGGDGDFFLDIAMPISVFQAATGLNNLSRYQVSMSSRTPHTQIQKDVPTGLSLGSPVTGGFSSFVPAPKPGTGLMAALGLCMLTAHSRRQRSASRRP